MKKSSLKGLVPLIMLGLSSSGGGLADNDVNSYISLSHKNETHFDSGFKPFEGPSSQFFGLITKDNIDGFLWVSNNNDDEQINEVDFGFGYTIGNSFMNARLGYERWEYIQDKGNNDALKLGVNFVKTPIDISLETTKFLDAKGIQYVGGISKEFKQIENVPIDLHISFKFAYLDEFFGISGHTNNSLALNINKRHKNMDFSIGYKYHDGKKDFKNSSQIFVSAGIGF